MSQKNTHFIEKFIRERSTGCLKLWYWKFVNIGVSISIRRHSLKSLQAYNKGLDDARALNRGNMVFLEELTEGFVKVEDWFQKETAWPERCEGEQALHHVINDKALERYRKGQDLAANLVWDDDAREKLAGMLMTSRSALGTTDDVEEKCSKR